MPALLKKYQTREDGFTLIELLIVVLIIGVLAAIAIPVYLGIQQQGSKAAIRSDVNIEVKRIQVGLTEGDTISNVKANQANYTQTSVKGEKAYIAASTTTGASANDFSVSNVLNTSTTPAGAFNYSYTYDSVTGNFTDSNSGLAFGSAAPTIAITTGSLATGVTGNAYSQTLTAITGNPSSTTVWSATGLPTNWSINASTGEISATAANVNTTGSYSVTVTATNGAVTDTRTYTLVVNSAPTVTTSTVPNGIVGTAYATTTFAASGTPATFTWTQPSGTLPTGLALSSAGVLSGTPTTAGTYTFGVAATNSAGTSATRSYTVVVNAAPTITTTSLPNAVAYTYQYNAQVASTSTPAATYSISGLPSGATYDSNTGAIFATQLGGGTGTFTVNITATNPYGSTSKNVTMSVSNQLIINGSWTNGTNSWSSNAGWATHASSENMTCPANNNAVIHSVDPNGSYLLYYSGNPGNGTTMWQDVNVNVSAGQTYSGGIWVAGCSNASQTGSIDVFEPNGSGGFTTLSVQNYSVGSGWNWVPFSANVAANASSLRFQVYPTSGQGNILFDNVILGQTG